MVKLMLKMYFFVQLLLLVAIGFTLDTSLDCFYKEDTVLGVIGLLVVIYEMFLFLELHRTKMEKEHANQR